MRRGPRDTRSWYRDADPMEQVDAALVDFVREHAGGSVLDLGCGLGGYSRVLAERGLEVRALDVVPEYVERARSIGVEAEVYDGERVPMADGSVDTVILLEVLEHLDDPARMLREARRVARRNVLVTTPNCTQDFGEVPVEFSHMLDVDHKHFFTESSLRALLDDVFGSSVVEQVAPIDRHLAGKVLQPPLRQLHRWLDGAGLVKPRFFFRLRGRAPAGP
jgi:2-polyprenyl-3-methyl-5-hydroxy-6-metoxy-1,4-benzoquinol methylase